MDIDKEGSRIGQFPALPKPQPPWETMASPVMIPDQIPPEVPVKLLGMPSNRGGWTWLEAPKTTEPLGPVDDGAVGWTGSYVHYI